MSVIDLTVSVDVEGSLDEDLQKEVGDIRAQFPRAMRRVASEMKSNLYKHIENDWYLPWGAPKRYKRRTDDPSLGTPLGSGRNMHVSFSSDGGLEFIYEPTGAHKNQKWNTAKGDALIKIIQDNDGWRWPPDKDKQGRNVMPRPFWNNFVDEQENGGIIQAFIAGMPKKYEIVAQGDDVILDGDEKL